MTGGYLQAFLFMMNRPEPIRQASLLMVLSTGVGQGASLLNSLEALAKESASPWSDRLNQLRVFLEHGTSLSDALASVPDLLPEHTRIAVRVAEKTGTLRQVLTDEAHRLMNPSAHNSALSRSLPVAILWVCLVGVILTGMISFLMVFIMPKFKYIFEDFGMELPPETQALIEIFDWGLDYWYLAFFPVASLLVATAGLAVWMNYQHVSRGRVLYSEHVPRFWTPLLLRMMSITVAAHRSLRDTLHHILSELRPGLAATRVSALRQAVDSGEDCFEAMHRLQLLRHHEAAFLRSAHRSQHADWGLQHLALSIDRRRRIWLQRLIDATLPTVVVLMGLIVGAVCVSMYLPLIKLINDLS